MTYISIIFNDLFQYLPKNNRKASMPAKMNTSMTSAGRTLSAQGRVSSTSSTLNLEVTPWNLRNHIKLQNL